jgi:hypothetical protein
MLELRYNQLSNKNMAEERFVHGFKVLYEEAALDGVRYLDSRLEREFALVFFTYAKNYRPAPLEDQDGRQYILSYKNEVYFLERK